MNRSYINKLGIFLLFLGVGQSVFSKEIRYLMRSPRALLMGDAYTAIAEDEYTLFYNPAGLSRNEDNVKFVPLSGVFDATNPYPEDMDRFKNLPSTSSGMASRFLGFPIYLRAGYAPSLKVQRFGISGIYNYSASLILRNNIHPNLEADLRYDRGIIMGYSHDLKLNKTHTFSLGFAWKSLSREGLKNNFDLFSPKLLNAVSQGSSDIAGIKESLGYARGKGMGFDTGILYRIKNKAYEFAFGSSILDIGDTTFKRTHGNEDIPVQDMFINTGVMFRQDFSLLGYTISGDIHPINAQMEFGRKLHTGLKLTFDWIPIPDLYIGFNSGYISYGFSANIGFFEVVAGLYTVELGGQFKEQPGNRGIIYLKMFPLLF